MINFQFSEVFGYGIMDLFCSYLVSFPTQIICPDVIEKAISKPDAVRCLTSAFLQRLSQRLPGDAPSPHLSAISPPHLSAPQTTNEQHEGTWLLCRTNALGLQRALVSCLKPLVPLLISWYCTWHRVSTGYMSDTQGEVQLLHLVLR